jgi:hypothetical protein
MISCLHTAESHIARFEALFRSQGWSGALHHEVRADLLARAQAMGAETLRADLAAVLQGLAGAKVVLCSCSTLGPLLEGAAPAGLAVVRIDLPLMERAAALGGLVLVAYCLPSTREATLKLFESCAQAAGQGAMAQLWPCAQAWPLFEAGEQPAFEADIAAEVRQAVAAQPALSGVVLAQASMAGAADLLGDLDLPVLSSPPLAVARAIALARA